MEKYLIYSVEDDEEIANIIKTVLTKNGYQVKTFADGESFLKGFEEEKPNMVLLDMMLPNIQGKEVLAAIRSKHSNDNVVVIIVSAKTLISERIDGLDEGADDYITKPFDLNEFISRVNAHARRSQYKATGGSTKTIGELTIDYSNRVLKKGNDLIDLTKGEFLVASLLFSKAPEIVSKDEIALELYGKSDDPFRQRREFRTIDMHIKAIRQKIGDEDKAFIVTVFNRGFKIIV
ncbi:MAG: response regulator transcription factor [Bacilli bacterium]|jgi:two-component system alkaline phosphatase synthesis response regulator PhoP